MNRDRLIKPSMGWITVTVSTFEGYIKQTVSGAEIEKIKESMDQNPVSVLALKARVEGKTDMPMAISLNDLLNMEPLNEDEIREAVEAIACQFQCGIVNEIGKLPPGFPDPDWGKGDKVFFQEGRGIDIGAVKLLQFDAIVGWDDEY